MSNTEYHIGKLIPIQPIDDNMTEFEFKQYIIKRENISIPTWADINEEDDLNEVFRDNNLLLYRSMLYSIKDTKFDPEDEVIEAIKKEDCIEYKLVFYNGGTSFDECLEEALDKLK